MRLMGTTALYTLIYIDSLMFVWFITRERRRLRDWLDLLIRPAIYMYMFIYTHTHTCTYINRHIYTYDMLSQIDYLMYIWQGRSILIYRVIFSIIKSLLPVVRSGLRYL